ncbi:MAG: hypothetical protein HC887_10170 [Desulfobacteraceae bacterium]|nr:hypothetical protein [Desulfobacteraceae bacterium]
MITETIIDNETPIIRISIDHALNPNIDAFVNSQYNDTPDWRQSQTFAAGDKVVGSNGHVYEASAGGVTTGLSQPDWGTGGNKVEGAGTWSDQGTFEQLYGGNPSNVGNFVFESDLNGGSGIGTPFRISKDFGTTDTVTVDWELDFAALDAAGYTVDYGASSTRGTVTLSQEAGASVVLDGLAITIVGDDKAEINTDGNRLEDIAVKISNAQWHNNGISGMKFTAAQYVGNYDDYAGDGVASTDPARAHLYLVDDDYFPGDAGNVQEVIAPYSPLNQLSDPYTMGSIGVSDLTEGGVVTIGPAKLFFQDRDMLASTDGGNTYHQDFSAVSYTVVTGPSHGKLFIDTNSSGAYDTGDTLLSSGTIFTQGSIINNQLLYAHSGGETVTDSFTYTVSDGFNVTYYSTVDDAPYPYQTAGVPFTFGIVANAKNNLPISDDQVFWVSENTTGNVYVDSSLSVTGPGYVAKDVDDSDGGPEYNQFATNGDANVYATAVTMGETNADMVTGSFIVYDPANWNGTTPALQAGDCF